MIGSHQGKSSGGVISGRHWMKTEVKVSSGSEKRKLAKEDIR
jgi:hypothetical protein